jgi:hypothetical protein
MIRACSTEIGCEPKYLKLETEKNDWHGALHCVTQGEFPCGVTKLPVSVFRQATSGLAAREGLDTKSQISSTKTTNCRPSQPHVFCVCDTAASVFWQRQEIKT